MLNQALTHSSHAHEEADTQATESAKEEKERLDNELLEFMGDSVLGFVTSQALFERFPSLHEGQLSKLRAHLVSARHLLRVAHELELGKYLHLGRGEEKSGGRHKSALLCDALEAVLAAMYVDGGLEPARKFILNSIIAPELERLQQNGRANFEVTDYKSALQEWLQGRGLPQPSYVVAKEEGPAHKKVFTVEVLVNREGARKPSQVARAEGANKKSAEQRAARAALEELQSQEGK